VFGKLQKISRTIQGRLERGFKPAARAAANREAEGLSLRKDVSIMAITASFSASNGFLSIFGDATSNNIRASRDAAGNILVNGGAVPILGGKATVANTVKIQLFGLDGNDTMTVDEANGAMPAVQMFGGAGNDTLTGGTTCCSAKRATTSCSARAVTICCSAAPATTPSPVARVTTRCSARPATTA
jgi:hypothetical protein